MALQNTRGRELQAGSIKTLSFEGCKGRKCGLCTLGGRTQRRRPSWVVKGHSHKLELQREITSDFPFKWWLLLLGRRYIIAGWARIQREPSGSHDNSLGRGEGGSGWSFRGELQAETRMIPRGWNAPLRAAVMQITFKPPQNTDSKEVGASYCCETFHSRRSFLPSLNFSIFWRGPMGLLVQFPTLPLPWLLSGHPQNTFNKEVAKVQLHIPMAGC